MIALKPLYEQNSDEQSTFREFNSYYWWEVCFVIVNSIMKLRKLFQHKKSSSSRSNTNIQCDVSSTSILGGFPACDSYLGFVVTVLFYTFLLFQIALNMEMSQPFGSQSSHCKIFSPFLTVSSYNLINCQLVFCSSAAWSSTLLFIS